VAEAATGWPQRGLHGDAPGAPDTQIDLGVRGRIRPAASTRHAEQLRIGPRLSNTRSRDAAKVALDVKRRAWPGRERRPIIALPNRERAAAPRGRRSGSPRSAPSVRSSQSASFIASWLDVQPVHASPFLARHGGPSPRARAGGREIAGAETSKSATTLAHRRVADREPLKDPAPRGIGERGRTWRPTLIGNA